MGCEGDDDNLFGNAVFDLNDDGFQILWPVYLVKL